MEWLGSLVECGRFGGGAGNILTYDHSRDYKMDFEILMDLFELGKK